MILAALLLVSALDPPELLGVTCSPVPGGALVKVLASAALDPQLLATERAGEAVVVTIPGLVSEAGLVLPAPVPPVLALSFQAAVPRARLRIVTTPGAMLETRVEGSLLTLVVHEAGAGPTTDSQDVEQLYPLLFPGQPEPTPSPAPLEESRSAGSGETGGWRLGALSLKPGLTLRYVDAESTFLDTPQPVRVQYYEIQPNLGLVSSSSVLGGRLELGYQPRFRIGENGIPILKRPSHFLDGSFDRPVGSSWWVTLADQYARGGIETQVVDPGREYFYDIAGFKRNQLSLGVRSETDGLLDVAVTGYMAKETIEPRAGYFSNERRGVTAALQYELGVETKLSLAYGFEHVPPPLERPLVESRSNSLSLHLQGMLTPLIRADVSAGYQRRDSPNVPAPGRRYSGLVVAAGLSREFVNGAQLSINGSRSTQLSAFESNAFYVADDIGARLRLPVWWSFHVEGGAGYHWNDYRLPAAGLGEPRQDRLFGWTVGLARPVTRWSYLRVDYSRDRRTSNVPGLSTRTHALLLSLGIGMGGGAR